MANHIDAIAADFSAIPFEGHEARRLAFAYLTLRRAVEVIAHERPESPSAVAQEALDYILRDQPSGTYSHPPEQEELVAQAFRYVEQVRGGVVLSTNNLADFIDRLARAYLDLLAAYEDRSKAFERAAADCVRLEGELEAAKRGADSFFERECELLRQENEGLRERLELIARNAGSWHHDADAKQRALNVIAAWASGGEIPEVLLTDLRSFQAHAHAEHLREAREVEQHQEEKHGE